MSQIGPYLSQMGPKKPNPVSPDWPSTYPRAIHVILKGTLMSRTKAYGLVLALLASAALTTACTRSDATGPSETPQVSFEEAQGGNNGK
jgi:hypothetical protein